MLSLRSFVCGVTLIAFAIGQSSPAQYGPEISIPVEGPTSVEILDIDNDNDNDVFIATRAGLLVFVNTDGAGTLSEPLIVGYDDIAGHVSDVDNDGHPDIVGSLDMSGGLHWYRNLGTFGFGPAQSIATTVTAEKISSCDLDGDDDQDLIMALDDQTIRWTMNQNGMGQFGPLSFMPIACNVADLQAIDFDQDGDLDLSWSSTSDLAFWAENTDGLGTFFGPLLVSSAGRGTQADLDGDGVLDLVLASMATQEAFWQRGNMNAIGYGDQALIAPISGPGPVLSTDLDGDGDRDVIATSSNTDEVFWYENLDGLGHFGPQQIVAAGVDDPMLLAAGDLNGDGDAEIFSASASQQRVVRYDNMTHADDVIVGRVFNDIDGDGQFNGADHGLYNMRVDLAGIGTTFTNHGGIYWFNVTPGAYSVQLPPVSGWQDTTPDTRSVSLGTPNNGSQGNDFGLQASSIEHELHNELTNAPTRCSTGINYWITVNNTGNQVEDVELILDLDDLSAFIWSEPAPTTNSGGVQTWNFSGVAPTHHRQVLLNVMMPDAGHMGEILHDGLSVNAYCSGSPSYTGGCPNEPVLECAYDPNDKTVMPEGDGQSHLTPMETSLTYTIRFQNTGTLSALDVQVIDQLDPSLDPQSFNVTAASHPVHTFIDATGLVVFDFEDIQLPDEASDEAGSQGFVRFRVSPLVGLPDMTPVNNHADIIFDANPAIQTNTTLNTLTYGMTGIDGLTSVEGGIGVFPNPAMGSATVHIGDELQGRVEVSVIDAKGRIVQQVSRQSSTVVLDRGDLPDGVYLLRAVDADGTEATTRLVWER